MEPIEFSTNPFGGVITNPANLPDGAEGFDTHLKDSIGTWKSDGHKVVWLEVPIEKSSLIPIAVDHGFAFHHSDEDHLMLTHRLEPDAFIPPFSTHYTGAGGVVLNEKQELLVVSERYRRSNTPSYKLPGGALQAGEHLHQCVVREVKEETGVDAEFVSLICFRHQHGYRYGKSDIYFVCRLRPLTQQVTIQAEEIAEALWMHIDEYLGAEGVSVFNKEIVRAALSSPGLTPSHIEGYTDPERHEVFMPRTDQT